MNSKSFNYASPENCSTTSRDDLLAKWMLVKEDKPNSCYTYADLLVNLEEKSASEVAIKLKCSTEELNC